MFLVSTVLSSEQDLQISMSVECGIWLGVMKDISGGNGVNLGPAVD